MSSGLPPLPDMPLLPITSEETLAACRSMTVSETDIFVCSYPKSGTTWMQNLVCRLLAAHLEQDLPEDWHLSHSAPFYEVNQYWKEDGSRLPAKTPLQSNGVTYRVFNTHLQPNQLPPNAKCVYVIRSPLDVLASFYYHLANQSEADGGYSGTAEEFCADFADGKVAYGKWQNHVEMWMGASGKEENKSCLVLHYETLKADLAKEAEKVAKFIGVDPERLQTVVESAVSHCTFEAMRQERWRYTPVSVEWKKDGNDGKSYDKFVRGGRVGDGVEFAEKYFSESLKKQWQEDLSVATKRWSQAGVDEGTISMYLK